MCLTVVSVYKYILIQMQSKSSSLEACEEQVCYKVIVLVLLLIMSKTLKSTFRLWKSYSRRFTPSLMSKVKSGRKREVSGTSDKIISEEEIFNIVLRFLSSLHENTSVLNKRDIMKKALGFSISRTESKLPGVGEGVILCNGSAKPGDVIALYPGTVYRRFEPILLPSIGNHFVLRCIDGLHIDGNDRLLSKIIYKSCVGRDSIPPLEVADVTWLTKNPQVPWNIGQYVNNGTEEFLPNVAYQELDLYNFPTSLYYLLPNVWYSGPREKHLRLVALVAMREIQYGEEVLSNYYTVIHE